MAVVAVMAVMAVVGPRGWAALAVSPLDSERRGRHDYGLSAKLLEYWSRDSEY